MNKKGFTLIELLVVIAIIGVMMAAVIVAINPTQRLQEARDSNKKQVVASVAKAMEECYVKNEGSYATCATINALVTGNFLKQDPTTGVGGTWAITAGCVSVDIEAGEGLTCNFWRYDTSSGRADCAETACS